MELLFRRGFSAVLFISLTSLAACGGGASGGTDVGFGPDGIKVDTSIPLKDQPLRVSFEPHELKYELVQNSTGNGDIVQGYVAAGKPPAKIYLGGVDLGGVIEILYVENSNNTHWKYLINPNSKLAVGQYSGSIRLFACYDENCNQHIAGSPAVIPYLITIKKAP